MKKIICALLVLCCFVHVCAFADGFKVTIPEFIEQYNEYKPDKPIEDISNGTVFGEGDVQYIRLKADNGVEIFLRYSFNVESELSGIIVMQKESKTDFEKLLSVATTAAKVITDNVTDDSYEHFYDAYKAICETVSYYGYGGKSITSYAKGYSVMYQIDDGTRQIFIAPVDN